MSDLNQRILRKAAIATSTGGQLSAENAKQFISEVIDQTPFLKDISTDIMAAASKNIDNIKIATRQMLKATEGTDPGSTITVTMPRRTLTTVEVIYPFDINYTFLEENIEAYQAENTIRKACADAFGNDVLDLNINGDESSATTFLQTNDGWITLAIADSTVHDQDIAGISSMEEKFYNMLALMPDKWNSQPDQRFLCSPAEELQYRYELSGRQTILGDKNIAELPPVFYMGRRVQGLYSWPSNYPILTFVKNLHWGIGRNFMLESEKDTRARVTKYTLTAKIDAEYAIGDAIVLGRELS